MKPIENRRIVAIECEGLIRSAVLTSKRWDLRPGEFLEVGTVMLMLRLNGASPDALRTHSDDLYYSIWYENCAGIEDYTAEECTEIGKQESQILYEDLTTISKEIQLTIGPMIEMGPGGVFEIETIEVDLLDNTLYVIYHPVDNLYQSIF